MRDNDDHAGSNANDAAGDSSQEKRGRQRRPRREGGFGRAGGFAQGLGGMFGGGGGFGPGQIMQLLPLILAMGGGRLGGGMAGLQLQLLMWVLEVWLDYLSAMQEVCERALERLQDLDLGGMFGNGQAENDEDW
jgi:hypothetical protein